MLWLSLLDRLAYSAPCWWERSGGGRARARGGRCERVCPVGNRHGRRQPAAAGAEGPRGSAARLLAERGGGEAEKVGEQRDALAHADRVVERDLQSGRSRADVSERQERGVALLPCPPNTSAEGLYSKERKSVYSPPQGLRSSPSLNACTNTSTESHKHNRSKATPSTRLHQIVVLLLPQRDGAQRAVREVAAPGVGCAQKGSSGLVRWGALSAR